MRSRSSVASKPTDTKPEQDDQARAAQPPMDERSSMGQAQNKLADQVEDDVASKERRQRSAQAAAPKRASELSMGTHARIVDHLFATKDPMEVYTRVRNGLSFGGRASSMGYAALADALDEAETNAHDAFELLVNTKMVADSLELDAKVIESALREQVLADLMEQKAANKAATGSTGKAITNDDIAAVMANKFPDEYRALEINRGRARRTVQALEDLAERSRERAKDLRALVGKARDA